MKERTSNGPRGVEGRVLVAGSSGGVRSGSAGIRPSPAHVLPRGGGKLASGQAKASHEVVSVRRGRPEGRGGLPRAAGTGYNKDQAAARSWVQQGRMEGDVGAPSKERE